MPTSTLPSFRGCPLTTRTGQVAWRATAIETLPSRNRLIRPRPRAPSTTRSAFRSRAILRISSFGLPITTSVSMSNPRGASLARASSTTRRASSSTEPLNSRTGWGSNANVGNDTAVMTQCFEVAGTGRSGRNAVAAAASFDPSVASKMRMDRLPTRASAEGRRARDTRSCGVLAFRAMERNRHRRLPEHLLGDASHQRALDAAAPARGQGDEVGAPDFGLFEDLLHGVAEPDAAFHRDAFEPDRCRVQKVQRLGLKALPFLVGVSKHPAVVVHDRVRERRHVQQAHRRAGIARQHADGPHHALGVNCLVKWHQNPLGHWLVLLLTRPPATARRHSTFWGGASRRGRPLAGAQPPARAWRGLSRTPAARSPPPPQRVRRAGGAA